jgi:hypothetical protein
MRSLLPLRVLQASCRSDHLPESPDDRKARAAQGMAAELTTGSLIKNAIKESGVNVSYLVIENKSSFYKKATGKIIFECNQGKELQDLFNSFDKDNNKAIIELKSIGTDSNNIKVSEFSFTWSLKVRS